MNHTNGNSNGHKPSARVVTPEMLKRVQDTVEFAKAALTRNAADADGVMVSVHLVKRGVCTHYFDATDFPVGDWGQAMVAMGVEAKASEMRAMTGRSKR